MIVKEDSCRRTFHFTHKFITHKRLDTHRKTTNNHCTVTEFKNGVRTLKSFVRCLTDPSEVQQGLVSMPGLTANFEL